MALSKRAAATAFHVVRDPASSKHERPLTAAGPREEKIDFQGVGVKPVILLLYAQETEIVT